MSANFIVSTRYDGKLRRLYEKTCDACDVVYHVPHHKLNKETFCSRRCANARRYLKVQVHCGDCGKELWRTKSQIARSKHRVQFCNRQCKEHAQSLAGSCRIIRPSHYGNGHKVYRNHVDLDSCAGCGDDRKCILMVHHIDGNRHNNDERNLEVVCPSCHSIRHLQHVNGEWKYNPHVLTPREAIKGFGTARSGHLIRNEEISRVQIPGGPPNS